MTQTVHNSRKETPTNGWVIGKTEIEDGRDSEQFSLTEKLKVTLIFIYFIHGDRIINSKYGKRTLFEYPLL